MTEGSRPVAEIPEVELVKVFPKELTVYKFEWTVQDFVTDPKFEHYVPAYNLDGAAALLWAERGPFLPTQSFIVSSAARLQFKSKEES